MALCFVYGTLKSGFQNHRVLQNSILIGEATTVEKYKMFKGRSFPFMLSEISDEGLNVIGELYEVDDSIIPEIDRFEGTPDLFFRQTIKVNISGEIKEAECYFLSDSYGFLMTSQISEYRF